MSQEIKPVMNTTGNKKSAPGAVQVADIDLMQDSTAALFEHTPRFGSYIMLGFIAFILVFFAWA